MYIYTYVNIYIYMCVYMHVHMYIYICIHAYFWWYTLKWGATWPLLGFPHLKRFFPAVNSLAQQDLVAEKLPKHSACRHGVWSLVHFVIFGWSLGFQQENQAANHQSMDLPSIDGDVTDIRGYSPSMRETNTCIYIYTCFNLFIWVTVKMFEDHFSTAGVFCQRCARNTVKR